MQSHFSLRGVRVGARVAALTVVCALGLVGLGPPGTAAAQGGLSASSFVERWSVGPLVQDRGNPIAESSPMVADLDAEGPAVVVGDRTGYLYAYQLSNGAPVPGWPVFDGGPPIDSTPSVAALGGSTLDSVFVGAGNAEQPDVGGYEAYGPTGSLLWHTTVSDLPSDPHPAAGVQASLTVADLQGSTDVFAGSLDQLSYALDAATGSVLPGWPFFSADSVFSTAAVGDLYGTGQDELVMGGASTAGLADGQSYSNGGHIRVLGADGALMYDYDTTQEVDSSPAIGDFLAGGAPGIVVGTGSYYAGASGTDVIMAFTTRLGLVWSDTLDGLTSSSPALADLQGNGQLEVVEGTDTGTSGSVWALDGATGAPIWHDPVVGRVIGSVVAADLTGNGYQDLLVPTTHGVEVMDGQDGAEITVLGADFGFQNSPLVTDDPNGTVGITIAGYNGNNEGVIEHYEIPGSDGALAVGPGSWPMFHHDPSLSGASSTLPYLGTVTPGDLTAQAGNGQVALSWAAPPPGSGSGPASGYNIYEATAPGEETGAPLNGSTPVTATSYAVTGLTNGTSYYFEVTAVNAAGEGAPSNEAEATPAAPPSAPGTPTATAGNAQVELSWSPPSSDGGSAITAYDIYASTAPGVQGTEVATVTGTSYLATGLTNGTTYYFEVAAQNAVGEGPTSAQVPATPAAPLTAPSAPGTPTATAGNAQVALSWGPPSSDGASAITGYDIYVSTSPGVQGTEVATVTGTSYLATGLTNGTTYYFEVAAQNAVGEGPTSAQVPATPVAPVAPPGYRVAAADGQVISFGKVTSYPSGHPGSAVVGVAATPDGLGYWLVTKGGGVIGAGDAHLYGSMGGKRLNSPVVGMAAAPNGRGYWLVGRDGGIFAFGDAGFYGSMGGKRLNSPVVGMAAAPNGRGYWLVGRDGGIFAFGDAGFSGSAVGRAPRKEFVGITG